MRCGIDDISVRRRGALAAIKTIHTAVWLTVESAVAYLLYTGVTHRTQGVGLAAGIVAAECAVFLGNGASCPLTGVAEGLGAESGSVTDLYLPAPLAKSLPVIHVPAVALILYLHRDRVRRLLGVS